MCAMPSLAGGPGGEEENKLRMPGGGRGRQGEAGGGRGKQEEAGGSRGRQAPGRPPAPPPPPRRRPAAAGGGRWSQ